MTYEKYTRELLEQAVAQSRTVVEVLRHLGIPVNGGSHTHISRRLKALEISTSHLVGAVHNRGGTSHNRKPPEQVLVRLPPDGRRTPGTRLRRAMRARGIVERCSWCGLGTTWNDKPLILHVDHVSGDFLDNRPENVRFLCPNCHSQTETHSGRKRRVMGPALPSAALAGTTPADPSREEVIGAVMRFNNGELTAAEVAQQIGCNPDHVFAMRRRLTEEGALNPHIHQRLRAAQHEAVVAFALVNPGNGYRVIRTELRKPEHGGMIISHDRIRTILRDTGLNSVAARRAAAAELQATTEG
jgi:hypothetical protein